jgi:hypothetical protein
MAVDPHSLQQAAVFALHWSKIGMIGAAVNLR